MRAVPKIRNDLRGEKESIGDEVREGAKEKKAESWREYLLITIQRSKVKNQRRKPALQSLAASSTFYPLYASRNRPAFPRSSKSHFSHICFESGVQNPNA